MKAATPLHAIHPIPRTLKRPCPLDPAYAPGTGTPEAGGMSSREVLNILRGLAPLYLVGADVVEVAPAYDHAAITAVAASHAAYELIMLMPSCCARYGDMNE